MVNEFDDAFKTVVKKFPFDDYLGPMCYYEMKSIVNVLRKFIPEFKGKKLLDIGSGPMDKTGIMQQLGFMCYAVDDLQDPWHIRNNNINKIKGYAKDLGINFYHQEKNDYKIPFDIGSFDVVCALAVIEHLHDSPREFLNTMGHFVKPGGLLLVEMPNSVNLRKRLSVILGKSNYNPIDELYFSPNEYRGHVREYTLDETVYILKQNKFEIMQATTFEHIAYEKLKFPMREIYLILGNLVKTLRSGLLVIARKPENWLPVSDDYQKYQDSISTALPKGVA
jgi:2-polyprenyl-3-methyl-5-hydroxy-6-metoxy-1,4-benzoquinol methylase